MRILHITAVRYGSTGRTAKYLKALLESKGHSFKIAYSISDNSPMDGDILVGNKVDHKLHAFMSRLTGLQGYWSHYATRRFLNKIDEFHPDIVQLGNLHANFLNLPLLFKYLSIRHIPVVMILHDCWFFTGKCTHFIDRGCNKWRSICNKCPALQKDNKSWFFDFSRKMFKDKEEWYSQLSSLTVIAVSNWQKSLAEKSPLFKGAKVVRIYNWIDTDVFKPASKEEKLKLIKDYNLSTSKKYVIAVGAGWKKDTSRVNDMLSFSKELPPAYQLIVVGKGEDSVFPQNVIHIPYIENAHILSVFYSMAVAYVHFSVEDSFGNVIAEAMSCGAVPIVFDSTACGETASPFGFSVRPHDTKEMISSLMKITDEDANKVREYAVNHYKEPENLFYYWETR